MGQADILSRQDLKSCQRISFVDRLGPFSRPLVRPAAAAGHVVIFMEAGSSTRRKAWYQAAIRGGHVREFNCAIFPSFEDYWRADDAALDAVEAVYVELKKQGMVPAAPLIELYKDAAIEAAYKKYLVVRLAEFFRTVAALTLLSHEGHPIEFYPSASWEEMGWWLALAGVSWSWPVGITINRSWRAKLASLESSLDSLKWWGILFLLPAWVLLGLRRITGYSVSPAPIQIGFRVYTTDWGFRGEGSREIDWLLDGKDLHRNNTLFVIEKSVPETYRLEFGRRGYRFVDVSGHEAFRYVSWNFLLRELFLRGGKSWARLVWARPSGMFHVVAVRGWLEYFRWTVFLEKWRPRHYVVYNHFHFEHVFRNARLRSVGAQSWYYVHSLHDANPFYLSSPVRSQADLAYLSYDNEVHWGKRDAAYHRGMFGQSRAYRIWGPLWSAHVSPSDRLNALLKDCRACGRAEAIVAVFDTSFGGASQYQDTNAKEFFEALAAMLDQPEWSNRLLIYKPKQNLKVLREVVSPEVFRSLARMLDHPRCLMVDSDFAPGVVIAEADLTVSIAFTSTTVEALGARQRAFYFDPGGEFPDSYYDQFPNLVAHDRKALARLCDYWLNLSEVDFQKYLDQYLAPEFGGCLDAGAVARFRSALGA